MSTSGWQVPASVLDVLQMLESPLGVGQRDVGYAISHSLDRMRPCSSCTAPRGRDRTREDEGQLVDNEPCDRL